MIFPLRRDAGKRVLDRRARRRRGGHEQPVAFMVPEYIRVPLLRVAAPTQHVAIPEPTTIKYLRRQPTVLEATRSKEPPRHSYVGVGGQFIVTRSENFVLARIRNVARIDPAVGHVFVYRNFDNFYKRWSNLYITLCNDRIYIMIQKNM